VLFKDEFEFQTVPFIVKVEVKEKFVNVKTGEMTSVSYDNTPKGYNRATRNWAICDVIIGRVRPNYPYTIDKEWPENIDKHFHTVVALEKPTRVLKWGFFPTHTPQQIRTLGEIDSEQIATKTIAKMKRAYENRDEVKSLTSEPAD